MNNDKKIMWGMYAYVAIILQIIIHFSQHSTTSSYFKTIILNTKSERFCLYQLQGASFKKLVNVIL